MLINNEKIVCDTNPHMLQITNTKEVVQMIKLFFQQVNTL
jgi:hypothetical protein